MVRRPTSTPDQMLASALHSIACRHAGWGRMPIGTAHDDAIAELQELAAGRTDLLAQVAGILAGAAEPGVIGQKSRTASQLLIDAGADLTLMPHWIEVGRERAHQAPPLASRYPQPAVPAAPPSPGSSRNPDRGGVVVFPRFGEPATVRMDCDEPEIPRLIEWRERLWEITGWEPLDDTGDRWRVEATTGPRAQPRPVILWRTRSGNWLADPDNWPGTWR